MTVTPFKPRLYEAKAFRAVTEVGKFDQAVTSAFSPRNDAR